jgi:hypothetical protein
MTKIQHTSSNGGAKGLIERLKKLSSQKVCVGVPGNGESSDHNYKGSNERKCDPEITNADLVYIHTHGVRPHEVRAEMKPAIEGGTKYSVALQMYIHEHGSFQMQVPARPIIEPAIEHAKEDLADLLKDAALVAMDGGDAQDELKKTGIEAQNRVKEWFTSSENGWAPNAASTIKRKGSDKPLVDTEALRSSITYVIRGGGG